MPVWWCSRCSRRFYRQSSLIQHLEDSPYHHECPTCDFDGHSWEHLLNHSRDEGCHTVCQGCDDGAGKIWDLDSSEYWDHVRAENVCTICERHFESPINLRQHQISHRRKDIDCYRCYDTFRTYGGMIIHLESGCCDEDVDEIMLNATAARCSTWREFMDPGLRDYIYHCHDVHALFPDKVYPYKCPTCDAPFSKLSSLFQHAESIACDQSVDSGAVGKLRRFLKSQYEL